MRILRLLAVLLVFVIGTAVALAQRGVAMPTLPSSARHQNTVARATPTSLSFIVLPTNTPLPFVARPTNTPIPDSDGDGILDDRDQCPNQFGDPANGGCPVNPQPQQPNPPAQGDSDGDGVLDSADSCPNAAGPAANNGCPLAPSPTPVPLPVLPTSGQCVLATQSGTRVNIREGTSTDTAIVGQIDPSQTYAVIGRNADGSWLQIDGGWVAAFVTRQGGDCGSLPDQVRTYNLINTFPIHDTGGDTTASGDLTNGSNPDPVLVALLLPAVISAREARRHSSCTESCPVPNPDDFAAALPFLHDTVDAQGRYRVAFTYDTVGWTDPESGTPVDTTLIYGTSDNGSHPGAINAVFCDGSVRFVGDSVQSGPLFGIVDPAGVEKITLPNIGFVVWGDSTANQIPFVLVRAAMPTDEQLQPVLQVLDASGVNTDQVALVDMRTTDASLSLLSKDTSAAGKWVTTDYNFELAHSDTDPLLWLVNDDGSIQPLASHIEVYELTVGTRVGTEGSGS